MPAPIKPIQALRSDARKPLGGTQRDPQCQLCISLGRLRTVMCVALNVPNSRDVPTKLQNRCSKPGLSPLELRRLCRLQLVTQCSSPVARCRKRFLKSRADIRDRVRIPTGADFSFRLRECRNCALPATTAQVGERRFFDYYPCSCHHCRQDQSRVHNRVVGREHLLKFLDQQLLLELPVRQRLGDIGMHRRPVPQGEPLEVRRQEIEEQLRPITELQRPIERVLDIERVRNLALVEPALVERAVLVFEGCQGHRNRGHSPLIVRPRRPRAELPLPENPQDSLDELLFESTVKPPLVGLTLQRLATVEIDRCLTPVLRCFHGQTVTYDRAVSSPQVSDA
uniref:Uncharacterized protein n=1 Tax=Rhodococcus erythropolis TaxID=1833 RepID=Q6XMT6_RHOER|nr:hypothetical protein PBD2.210 [Rhodococcus erythropolis]